MKITTAEEGDSIFMSCSKENEIHEIMSKSRNFKINSIDDVYLVDKNIRLLTEEYIDNNYGNIK